MILGRLRRSMFLAVGWICVGLGFIGVWLPLMPTTVFLLIACWAFARSSPEIRAWLLDHPRFGRALADWHEHGAISPAAKWSAVVLMAASFGLVLATTDMAPLGYAALALLLAACAAYVVTRPLPTPPSAALKRAGPERH